MFINIQLRLHHCLLFILCFCVPSCNALYLRLSSSFSYMLVSSFSPIRESRRVLQESCEFFLRHNSKVKHKKKHYKSSSHRLKVISKSMGTSTGGTTNHGTSAVAITNHDYLSQETVAEIKTSPETSEKEADGTSAQKVEEGENSGNQMLCGSKLTVDQVEKRNKADSTCDMSSLSGSVKRIGEGR